MISIRMSSNADTGDIQESLKHGLTSVGKSELFSLSSIYILLLHEYMEFSLIDVFSISHLLSLSSSLKAHKHMYI